MGSVSLESDLSFPPVLVAVQVVRQEADGSVVVACKLLKSYPTPELVRQK